MGEYEKAAGMELTVRGDSEEVTVEQLDQFKKIVENLLLVALNARKERWAVDDLRRNRGRRGYRNNAAEYARAPTSPY